MNNLLDAESHFAFGENWQSFAAIIDDSRIANAQMEMRRLFPDDELRGASFLDIGCGSGLSSLAAARLGAASIDALDIDKHSVDATKQTLLRYLPDGRWDARVESVFNLDPKNGQYDIVYSWGVLHHTGDMWRAIKIAGTLVRPGGRLALAIYRKTPLCGFWTAEKKFYVKSGTFARKAMRAAYKSAFVAALVATGRNPSRYISQYQSHRGMDWSHDVHDWLGGYPYESATPQEIGAALNGMGFEMVRSFTKKKLGLFGSGCDEFVAVRKTS